MKYITKDILDVDDLSTNDNHSFHDALTDVFAT